MTYRWNYYNCTVCKQSTVSKAPASLVTPMFSICQWCGGRSTSAMAFRNEVTEEELKGYPIIEFFLDDKGDLGVKTVRHSPFVHREILKDIATRFRVYDTAPCSKCEDGEIKLYTKHNQCTDCWKKGLEEKG